MTVQTGEKSTNMPSSDFKSLFFLLFISLDAQKNLETFIKPLYCYAKTHFKLFGENFCDLAIKEGKHCQSYMRKVQSVDLINNGRF